MIPSNSKCLQWTSSKSLQLDGQLSVEISFKSSACTMAQDFTELEVSQTKTEGLLAAKRSIYML